MNNLFIQEVRLAPKRLRQIIKESNRSYLSVIFEYIKLRYKIGLEFNEYYRYEFEKADAEFFSNFLSNKQQLKYLEILNSVKYYFLAKNKFLTNILLKKLNIPTTNQLFYYDPSAGISEEYLKCSEKDVVKYFNENNINSFFYKISEGRCGIGAGKIIKVNNENGKTYFVTSSNENLKPRDIFSNNPLVVEELVSQTSQMASLNPDSVNTMRIITALFPNNDVKVVTSVLKIGRNGRFVDNAAKGGNIMLWIDPVSGISSNPVQFDGFRRIIPITYHPDSLIKLTDFKLENWDNIISKVKKYQAKIPFLKIIGWDIAITNEGPVVIEINHLWDTDYQYFIKKCFKNDVKECYESWLNLTI